MFFVRQGSSHNRGIQNTGYLLDNGIIRHTDTNLLPVTEYFRQTGSAVQDESESTGQVPFHQLECIVIYFGIFTDATQVIANNRKVVFARINFFDTTNTFDSTLFQPMATNGIHGVGGIDDKSTVIQNIHYLLQVLWIVVLFVQF